jgi:hypothetical protein
LYGCVQPSVSNYSATFNGGKDFNQMDWKSIQSSQSYFNMQLCHGYDKENFPFVIATDSDKAKVFLVNVNTQNRV